MTPPLGQNPRAVGGCPHLPRHLPGPGQQRVPPCPPTDAAPAARRVDYFISRPLLTVVQDKPSSEADLFLRLLRGFTFRVLGKISFRLDTVQREFRLNGGTWACPSPVPRLPARPGRRCPQSRLTPAFVSTSCPVA